MTKSKEIKQNSDCQGIEMVERAGQLRMRNTTEFVVMEYFCICSGECINVHVMKLCGIIHTLGTNVNS